MDQATGTKSAFDPSSRSEAASCEMVERGYAMYAANETLSKAVTLSNITSPGLALLIHSRQRHRQNSAFTLLLRLHVSSLFVNYKNRID